MTADSADDVGPTGIDIGIPGLTNAELIGRGGFGAVFKAHQADLDRTVAVKVFQGSADDAEMAQFTRECQAIGRLDWCPQIVSVYSSGVSERGEPYLIMEYAAGGSLLQMMRGPGATGTIAEDVAIRIATSIAMALKTAHASGILHRDVKPGNILISRAGEFVLADFGIARLLTATSSRTLGMSGTVAYAAPEVLNEEPATPRSDLFSLGATIYTALAGHSPHALSRDDPMSAMVTRALTGPGPDLASLNVGSAFRAVLTRCLARHPSDRYSDAGALVDALLAVGAVGAGAAARNADDSAHYWPEVFYEPGDDGSRDPDNSGQVWPTATEYVRAIQETAAPIDSVPTLSTARLSRDHWGMPVSASGQNAVVFELATPTGPLALRCYTRAPLDGAVRCRQMSDYIVAHPHPAVPPSRWISQGLVVDGIRRPAVLMPWVEGVPLNLAVEERLANPASLRDLAGRWLVLLDDLQNLGVAHGDLQCGNVLVDAANTLRLVDMDEFYVPGMTAIPRELGHPNFQHPQRLSEHWGPDIDAFSGLVGYLSLIALAGSPDLWRFHNGENLILSAIDFANPHGGEIWTALDAHPDPEVRRLTALLRDCLAAPYPPQADFVLRHLKPQTHSAVPGLEMNATLSTIATGVAPTGAVERTAGAVETASRSTLGPSVPASQPDVAATMMRSQLTPATLPPTPHDLAPMPGAAGMPGPPGMAGATGSPGGNDTLRSPGGGSARGMSINLVGSVAGDQAWWNEDAAARVEIPSLVAPPPHQPAASRATSGLARNTMINGAMAGVVGGLIACGIYVLTARPFFKDAPELRGVYLVALVGFFLTLGLAALSSAVLGSWARAARLAALGAAAGLVLNAGLLLMFGALTRSHPIGSGAITDGVRDVKPWYAITVWVLTGLGTGSAIGLVRWSRRVLVSGVAGGLVGGLIGGGLYLLTDPPVNSSNVLWFKLSPPKNASWSGEYVGVWAIVVLTCTLIGLSIGVVERLRRQTWLKVMEGPNRGVEVILTAGRTTIGSSPSCALRVLDATHVLPEHIVVVQRSEGYGLQVNGPVEIDGRSQAPSPIPVSLTPGNVIRLQGTFIRFESVGR